MNVGLDLGQMFKMGTDSMSSKGADLQAKMNELSSKGNIGPEEMLPLQFEMGQYTAFMEAVSATTKSLLDMLKSLAQRSG